MPLVFAGPSSIRREPPAFLREPGTGSGAIPQLPRSGPVATQQAYVPPRSASSAQPPADALNPDGSKKMWGYANPNYRERTPARPGAQAGPSRAAR